MAYKVYKWPLLDEYSLLIERQLWQLEEQLLLVRSCCCCCVAASRASCYNLKCCLHRFSRWGRWFARSSTYRVIHTTKSIRGDDVTKYLKFVNMRKKILQVVLVYDSIKNIASMWLSVLYLTSSSNKEMNLLLSLFKLRDEFCLSMIW